MVERAAERIQNDLSPRESVTVEIDHHRTILSLSMRRANDEDHNDGSTHKTLGLGDIIEHIDHIEMDHGWMVDGWLNKVCSQLIQVQMFRRRK